MTQDLAVRRRRRMIGASVVASAAGLGWFVSRRSEPTDPVHLPDMIALDRQSIPGNPDGRRGLFVTFWATSCAVCVAEMPSLGRLHREGVRHGLRSIAVAMPYDSAELLGHFARMNPGAPPIVFDETGAITRALGPVRATPTHVLLDAHNRIVFREAGGLQPQALSQALRMLDQRRS